MTEPKLFALPPGAAFPAELARGLIARFGAGRPEDFARVEVLVNTRRMQRALTEALAGHGPRLLPRIRTVTDIGATAILPGAPPPVPPLRRRLELAVLVRALLAAEPDLAPRSAVFDLAASLAALLDEMQGEGVDPARLEALPVGEHSEYWDRSLRFLTLLQSYLAETGAADADPEARQRRAVERLAETWRAAPPGHPVVLAGSTGSRGSTAVLMDAVARLPKGAVVLPGFDFEMPRDIWPRLTEGDGAEDHPQHRFAALLDRLRADPADVRPWTDAAPPVARNRLVSLALRPAPVTDQWMTEGQELKGIDAATAAMTLVEAPSQRVEALAIALRLRQAAEEGRTAALVTPDRMLTRRVAAVLDRWGIEPDDSAGRPLALSPPGRFLRHVAELFTRRAEAEDLLVLLKHPLANSGAERGNHLLWARELELRLRREGVLYPDATHLSAFAEKRAEDGVARWADWVASLTGDRREKSATLSAHVARHRALAEAIAAGPGGSGSGALWDQAAGREARAALDRLAAEGGLAAEFTAEEYRDLLAAELNAVDLRDRDANRRGIMIWGTLESRVQGADLVILGSLNDGTWPETPAPDPWLNRALRREAGLLLPDRRIGLSAHDFQQAIAAPEVVLTRAARDAEAETVPSRWLNRLTNLLAGLKKTGGEEALKAMRARGRDLVRMAEDLDRPSAEVPPSPRPSPRPPVAARPKQLSVTQIQTLIRNPYEIYARNVLGLRRLDPLRISPDAPLRGTVVHLIFERLMEEPWPADPASARARLLAVTDEVLATEAPWPATRAVWRARIERVADWFVERESARQAAGPVTASEVTGGLGLEGLDFRLTGKADRIDRLPDGSLAIYDYKTGNPPSEGQIKSFDKQLLLEAAMAEAGAFTGIPAAPVAEAAYIGLGSSPAELALDLAEPDDERLTPAESLAGLIRLIGAYGTRSRGYTARRAMESVRWDSHFDHLARFGEWTDADDPTPEDVG